ncbi:P2Y purinoceptor 13-like [Engraulis encrasicolus]|uniref:P2Y purinoceptor 13-like n=1 Tax=Engraulis encrasicolus TaxID=184585 RepID=UPI002FCF4AED
MPMFPLTTQSTAIMATSPALPDCPINPYVANLVIMVLYLLLFVPALLLNITAAWISWKLETKSSFIVYLKNLVAADLLMTLTLLLKASGWHPRSPLGLQAFNCQFTGVIFYLCLYVSILLMGAISINRFFKIVKPFGKMFGQRATFGKVVSALIWIVLLCTCTIPTMVNTNAIPQNKTGRLCMDMKDDMAIQYHEVVVTFCFVIFFAVSLIMGFCYICIAKTVIKSYQKSKSNNEQGNRKIRAHVFIVLVVFLVCFAPFHIVRMFFLQQQMDNDEDCSWAVAKHFTLWLATTNVCLDPLIYIGLCKAFREKLHKLKLFGYLCSTTTEQITDSSL